MNVDGNPIYFHNLVTFCQPGGPLLSVPQQQQMVNKVCQGAILMSTEAAAKRYRTAVKQLGKHCPDLISRDRGSRIRAGGSYTIGPGACAPSSSSGLEVCVGAPVIQLSQEYIRYNEVLRCLANMALLTKSVVQARVSLEQKVDSLLTEVCITWSSLQLVAAYSILHSVPA